MKKKNYLKVRFNLWTKSFHFKRFQTIMIVVCLLVIGNCAQGNYDSIMAIPCAALLFGFFTLFPKHFPRNEDPDFDTSLEEVLEIKKQQDYEEYLNSPEYKREQREKKLKRVYKNG